MKFIECCTFHERSGRELNTDRSFQSLQRLKFKFFFPVIPTVDMKHWLHFYGFLHWYLHIHCHPHSHPPSYPDLSLRYPIFLPHCDPQLYQCDLWKGQLHDILTFATSWEDTEDLVLLIIGEQFKIKVYPDDSNRWRWNCDEQFAHCEERQNKTAP